MTTGDNLPWAGQSTSRLGSSLLPGQYSTDPSKSMLCLCALGSFHCCHSSVCVFMYIFSKCERIHSTWWSVVYAMENAKMNLCNIGKDRCTWQCWGQRDTKCQRFLEKSRLPYDHRMGHRSESELDFQVLIWKSEERRGNNDVQWENGASVSGERWQLCFNKVLVGDIDLSTMGQW